MKESSAFLTFPFACLESIKEKSDNQFSYKVEKPVCANCVFVHAKGEKDG